MSASNQQFSLRWNNYVHHITYAFDSLRSHEDLVDVTLCCEGRKIRAHKILLSACSTYFKDVFKENPCQHPVIVFKNVKYDDLLAIIQFMYQGEVNVQQESLPSFLNTAEMLAVQGLTDANNFDCPTKENVTKIGQKIIPVSTDIKSIPYALTTTAVPAVPSSSSIVRTLSMKSESQENNPSKKRRLSHEEDEEEVEEEASFLESEELNRSDMNLQEESASHYLKMEMPEYIDVDNSQQSHQQSQTQREELKNNMQQKEDDEVYKAIEEQESDMEIIYQDPNRESPGLTSVEMGRIYTSQQSSDGTQNKQQTSIQELEIKLNHELKCDMCGRKFTSVSTMKRHKESKHTENCITFGCIICNKSFKTKWSLSTHTSRFHRKKHRQSTLILPDRMIQNKYC